MGCVTGLLGLPAELYPHRIFNCLLSSQLLYYSTAAGNVKEFFEKIINFFVKKKVSIARPIQSLDSVCSPTAILLGYHRSQSVNPQAKICVAAGHIIIAGFG